MKKLVLTAVALAALGIAGVAAAQDASFGAPLQGLPNLNISIPGSFSVLVEPEKYAVFSVRPDVSPWTDDDVAIMQPWAADVQAVQKNAWTLKTNTPVKLALYSGGFKNYANGANGENASIMDDAVRYAVYSTGSEVYNAATYASAPTPAGTPFIMAPNGSWTLDLNSSNTFGEVWGNFNAFFSPDAYVYGFGDASNTKGNEWTDILAGAPVMDHICVLITD